MMRGFNANTKTVSSGEELVQKSQNSLKMNNGTANLTPIKNLTGKHSFNTKKLTHFLTRKKKSKKKIKFSTKNVLKFKKFKILCSKIKIFV